MNEKPFRITVAQLAFFALFPGFFFYQSALGAGLIGPVLEGYFSPVTLIFMPFLALSYMREAMRNKRFLHGLDFGFWGFLAYFFFVVAFHYGTGAPKDVIRHHALAIVQLAAVFIIFRLADFEPPLIRRACFVCLAAMTAIIFIMSVDGAFYLKLQADASDGDSVATYQGFARSYLTTALIVIPYSRSIMFRLLFAVIAGAALFTNGARTELLVFVLLAIAIEILHSRHRALLLTLFASAAAGLLFYADEVVAMLPINRSVQLLDISHASSWETRDYLFAQAWKTISAHPLAGDYASYFYLFSSDGSYAHNIFSAWVDLGLAGFVALLVMSIYPMWVLFMLATNREKLRQHDFMLTFGLMLTTLIMLFGSKSFTYMMVGAMLGRYAYYRKQGNYAKSGSSDIGSSALRHADFHQAMPQPRLQRL